MRLHRRQAIKNYHPPQKVYVLQELTSIMVCDKVKEELGS